MIFSILALLTICISINIKDRNKSLYVQSLNCLFEAIYDFIISAFTGAILSIINLIRTFIFINKSKFNKCTYLIIFIAFLILIILNCYFSWSGFISLLPTIASIIRLYSLWQTDMKLVRISGITTGILYGLYYFYYQSWFMVIGDIVLFLSGVIALLKNDIIKTVNM